MIVAVASAGGRGKHGTPGNVGITAVAVISMSRNQSPPLLHRPWREVTATRTAENPAPLCGPVRALSVQGHQRDGIVMTFPRCAWLRRCIAICPEKALSPAPENWAK